MVDVELRGGEGFERLARALHAAAPDLQPEVMAAIRKAAEPAEQRFQSAASTNLPSEGGLARDVARVHWAIDAARDEIRIHPTDSPYDLTRLNEGRLAHPVYGNRDVWVEQDIEPGWAEEPTADQERAIADAVEAAERDLVNKIERNT